MVAISETYMRHAQLKAFHAVAVHGGFSRAAEALGRDIHRPPLPEHGPTEVRRAARAFNTMQTRLQRFIQDRTQMLAAISHDLRTPITRLRLRAEFVEFRSELKGTQAARDAARFLLVEPPLPLAARPAYALLATAALAPVAWAQNANRW